MNEDIEALQRRVSELEAQVQERTELLSAANREMEDLAHFISHDLRAPLRGIDGYSQMLIEEYALVLDEIGRAYLQYIHDASLQAAALIDRLLYYSRALRSPLQPETVNLSALAEEIAARLHHSQPERQVKFVIAPDMQAEADRKMMRTLMENLLDNAWKFTSKHPTARIEVGIQPLPEDCEAIQRACHPTGSAFFVRDDGAGFNMAYQNKLFIPFQRLHGTHEFDGLGIGLPIAQRIARRHGGEMWAEGAVEKGATVYFTLGA